MNTSTSRKTSLILSCFFSLLLPAVLWAGELVDCRYMQASGKEIRLEIKIRKPPPASIIFVQQLPKDVHIKRSSPRLKKFTPRLGEAKWLIKRPKPGLMSITMTLDRPVDAGGISGEIRYKNPKNGRMVSTRVHP